MKTVKAPTKKADPNSVRREAINALLADNINNAITPADLRQCFKFVMDAIVEEEYSDKKAGN